MLKLRIKNNSKLLVICIYVSMSIYVLVVIEDYYHNVVIANPDLYFKATFGVFAIVVFGFVIFLLVKMSKPFGNMLLKTFGVDVKEKEKPVTKDKEVAASREHE